MKKMMKKRLKTSRERQDPADFMRIGKKIKPVEALGSLLKVVLYGKAGTGKTTLASSFPKPSLLIDCSEKGTDSVREEKGVHVLKCTEWQDFLDAYWYVKQTGKFKTVIIDTVSNIQDLAVKQVLVDANKATDNIGGWGTMARGDWGKVSTMMKQNIFNYRDLDVNVVFIAHDRISRGHEEEEEEDNDGQILPEVGPRLMPSVASSLNAAVGVIGNTFIRERIREVKIGKKRVAKRRVDYCLRIGPHAYYTTKIRKPKRIQAPAFIVDPDYDKLMDVIKGEYDG